MACIHTIYVVLYQRKRGSGYQRHQPDTAHGPVMVIVSVGSRREAHPVVPQRPASPRPRPSPAPRVRTGPGLCRPLRGTAQGFLGYARQKHRRAGGRPPRGEWTATQAAGGWAPHEGEAPGRVAPDPGPPNPRQSGLPARRVRAAGGSRSPSPTSTTASRVPGCATDTQRPSGGSRPPDNSSEPQALDSRPNRPVAEHAPVPFVSASEVPGPGRHECSARLRRRTAGTPDLRKNRNWREDFCPSCRCILRNLPRPAG